MAVWAFASGVTFCVIDTATNCTLLKSMSYSEDFRKESLFKTDNNNNCFLYSEHVKSSTGTYVTEKFKPLTHREAKTWLVANLGTYSLAAPLRDDNIWDWIYG